MGLRDLRRFDLLLAVGLAVAGVIEGLNSDTHPGVRAVAGASAALPLLYRRTNPPLSAVSALPLAVGAALRVDVDNQIFPFGCVLIAFFSLGLYGGRRQLAIGLPIAAGLAGGSVVLSGAPADLLYLATLIALAVVPARLLRRRLHEVEKLTEQKLRAEAEVEARARAAAVEERTRVARELHDIIGHGVSLMVVQAAAAEAHLDDRDIARRSLEAIQEAGRQAVADLARLLGLLREDHPEFGNAPQPGLAELEELAAVARASGEDVSLTIEGDSADVPATVGLTVYRVAQEALTNARRHAPGAPVVAHVRVAPRAVTIDVTNGASSTAGSGPGGGQGLAGLRERVAMFGGTLRFGPATGGGFTLRAEVPVA